MQFLKGVHRQAQLPYAMHILKITALGTWQTRISDY